MKKKKRIRKTKQITPVEAGFDVEDLIAATAMGLLMLVLAASIIGAIVQ